MKLLPLWVRVVRLLIRMRLPALVVRLPVNSMLFGPVKVAGLPVRKRLLVSALAPVRAPASERSTPPPKLNWLPVPIWATPRVLFKIKVPWERVVIPV